MIVASLAMGTALSLTVPAAASAQTVVSQGTGRLVTTSLLSSALLDSLVTLKGANAINTAASGDVVANTPLDAAALGGLAALRVGATSTPLFGDAGGVIRLGVAGQYARANNDGSSVAFSGSVNAAPGLIGVGTGEVKGAPVGTPTAGSSATIAAGTPVIDSATLLVEFATVAASASESTTGAQTGQYRLGAVGLSVGGQIVATPVSTISPALDALITLFGTAGVPLPQNPFPADMTVRLTTEDLQAAGLGSDLNNLPPDTNLTDFVPSAVSTFIKGQTDDFLATATAAVASAPAATQAALRAALTSVKSVVDPIEANLGSAFQGPLGIALRNVAQLVANHRETVGGAFTETALRVGLGPNGSAAQVDLGGASVGPNAAPPVQPTTTPTATSGTGGSGNLNGTGTGTGTGTGATLAHTGLPLETQLLPWGALAFVLLAAGFAAFTVTAKRRARGGSRT